MGLKFSLLISFLQLQQFLIHVFCDFIIWWVQIKDYFVFLMNNPVIIMWCPSLFLAIFLTLSYISLNINLAHLLLINFLWCIFSILFFSFILFVSLDLNSLWMAHGWVFIHSAYLKIGIFRLFTIKVITDTLAHKSASMIFCWFSLVFILQFQISYFFVGYLNSFQESILVSQTVSLCIFFVVFVLGIKIHIVIFIKLFKTFIKLPQKKKNTCIKTFQNQLLKKTCLGWIMKEDSQVSPPILLCFVPTWTSELMLGPVRWPGQPSTSKSLLSNSYPTWHIPQVIMFQLTCFSKNFRYFLGGFLDKPGNNLRIFFLCPACVI